MNLKINDTFNQELPADPDPSNSPRQVHKACFSLVTPRKTADPKIIHSSIEVAELLGISTEETKSDEFRDIFTGNKIIPNTNPYAMCYGGHQFGHWAGQLGDGRAINLAEVLHNNKRWAMQLKGSGETPYSRTADGLAVLRSSIREYLCSEAMYHLGVPTTRALSLALTGDEVLRDVMYNGNAAYEKGAVVCRVSPSFIRFGNFEIFAARKDYDSLKKLTDYTIKHFFPELGEPSKETYLAFFKTVAKRTMDMIVHWQRVGFVHGVMNTDNFSILGLTIDYGPYGWLEGYDHNWTPNTTDRQNKRYRYGNQSNMGVWNVFQLANALFPLINDAAPMEAFLKQIQLEYRIDYINMMRDKLGLKNSDAQSDEQLIVELEQLLQSSETDMTIFFRNLSNISKDLQIESENSDFLQEVKDAFYQVDDLKGETLKEWKIWFENYLNRLAKEDLSDAERKTNMDAVNPKYVLRNYMAQLAIDDADKGNYELIDTFLNMLRQPYSEQTENQKWFAKRPEWARNKVGCSMLSCSS